MFKNKVLTSILIPLTEEVCSYLLEDSTLVLPQEVYSRKSNIALSEDGGDCLVGEDAQNDTTEIEVSIDLYFCIIYDQLYKVIRCFE